MTWFEPLKQHQHLYLRIYYMRNKLILFKPMQLDFFVTYNQMLLLLIYCHCHYHNQNSLCILGVQRIFQFLVQDKVEKLTPKCYSFLKKSTSTTGLSWLSGSHPLFYFGCLPGDIYPNPFERLDVRSETCSMYRYSISKPVE